MRAGTWTVRSANFTGWRKSARYQLIMLVRAPGCDHAARYSARSWGEKVPGRLDRSRPRAPRRKSKAEKSASGNQGSWKKNIYQLRRIWRGRVRRKRRITEGCGTLRIASFAIRCGCERAALHATAAPQS